ncbi:(2Fe-2S) ferredoxin domain-containing protein [Desulfoscipio gibsoniae]|uniref:NADH:ubiquinone oxidoreductase, NADH-binding (51 kD) subunit n=1 Tax=Desulfoscipio gibsoniae DSM 7213 TaxID=767817 RepID=R4KIH5_9FIRM|nr:NADH-ubiquinone oxidoreductase-F iron-sulfur binding region domain-containing protein [Desulfoscipio gibsoniae]AGL01427.1 NADH:ubiquinone oxidoreductase, NADH-binding (51 kD) subunit [Desulfoscipio gibsoniae DSM 7213]
MARINSVAELEELRKGILSKIEPDKPCIAICAGIACLGLGNDRVISAFEEEIRKQSLETKVDIRATGCHGFCEKGPIVVIYPEEICYLEVTPEDVPEIITQTVVGKKVIDRLIYTDPNTGAKAVHQFEIPFYKNQSRLLIGNNPKINPKSIEDYLAIGGYSALAKALFAMNPEQVLEEIKKANLRGRGGGGFPAGSKWETTRNAPGEEKYVIVNAHEGEPGAFMDRALFTGNPHLVLEGLIIGAYTIGSHQGFIYTRHDTPQLRENIDIALSEAKEYGLLGKNILGSGFNFNVEVHLDVGIFVSGESSALMRSIEGKAPEPRPKYIRTSVSGIWNKPSNLNNVETWANVPQIINNGSKWYSSIGTERSKGTKLISLSGNICNTGVVEVPMGTSLKEIIYNFGGGIPNGKKLKAVHFGGPMGGSIPESLIDSPLDFDVLSKLGTSLGAGDMLVLDEDNCMVEVARYFLDFLSGESCGKCVPCREGIRQMLKILTDITDGKGKEGDIELLEEIAGVVGEAALCSLGRSVPKPLLSMLKYFRDEYEAHIKDKRCPALFCKELKKGEL